LRFPDAPRKLKAIEAAERRALNGDATPLPPVAQAVEITEADIQRAARDLREGYHRHVPRGAHKRNRQKVPING
jgi:hypothetical protein